MILELQVVIRPKKKCLKEHTEKDATGQCVWEHDGSSISRRSSNESGILFKTCSVLDKIEGPTKETAV